VLPTLHGCDLLLILIYASAALSSFNPGFAAHVRECSRHFWVYAAVFCCTDFKKVPIHLIRRAETATCHIFQANAITICVRIPICERL